MHRGHMFLNFLGDFGLIRLRQRFNAIVRPRDRAANVRMMSEQIMKNVLVRSHRCPWTATPAKPRSPTSAHSPWRPLPGADSSALLLLEHHKVILPEQIRLFAYLFKAGLA